MEEVIEIRLNLIVCDREHCRLALDVFRDDCTRLRHQQYLEDCMTQGLVHMSSLSWSSCDRG